MTLLRDTIRQMLEMSARDPNMEKYFQKDLRMQSNKMPTWEELFAAHDKGGIFAEEFYNWYEWPESVKLSDFSSDDVMRNEYEWRQALEKQYQERREMIKNRHQHPEIQAAWEQYTGYFKDYYDEAVESLRQALGRPLVRVICLPEGQTPDDLDELGIYWTDSTDEDYEPADAGAKWSEGEGTCYTLYAKLSPDNIDWYGTLLARTTPGWQVEAEVRLMKGAPVFLLAYAEGYRTRRRGGKKLERVKVNEFKVV